MNRFRLANFFAGAIAVAALSVASNSVNAPRLVEQLNEAAVKARDEAGGSGVKIRFMTAEGWLSRHPRLTGGDTISQEVRARTAAAIVAVPGVGGIIWSNPSLQGGKGAALHCQDDVESILAARSIRFDEASAQIEPASERVLDEVATALVPCVGSIIAVTGHTDGNGDPNANLALSRARADAVRWALIGRGIPSDGLRATGKGMEEPLEGLDPVDPANRRIEFSVIETVPIKPTPIDTPGPG